MAGMLMPAIAGGFGTSAAGGLGGLLGVLGGPVGLAALGLAPLLFGGGTTVGPAAPAFQPGPSNGVTGTGGLLGQSPNQQQSLPSSASGVSDLLKGTGADEAAAAPIESIVEDTLKQSSLEDIDLAGPLASNVPDKSGNLLSGMLGGLDKGLQSPSQLLALGALSRMGGNNNALPIAGLLGMGLLNRDGGLLNR